MKVHFGGRSRAAQRHRLTKCSLLWKHRSVHYKWQRFMSLFLNHRPVNPHQSLGPCVTVGLCVSLDWLAPLLNSEKQLFKNGAGWLLLTACSVRQQDLPPVSQCHEMQSFRSQVFSLFNCQNPQTSLCVFCFRKPLWFLEFYDHILLCFKCHISQASCCSVHLLVVAR